MLNGVVVQDYDRTVEKPKDWTTLSKAQPTKDTTKDLSFAWKAVNHLKSNGIAIVKDRQLIGMGCGQTSRVDALKQAIAKAKAFGFSVEGAVFASDAFFPFPDWWRLQERLELQVLCTWRLNTGPGFCGHGKPIQYVTLCNGSAPL